MSLRSFLVLGPPLTVEMVEMGDIVLSFRGLKSKFALCDFAFDRGTSRTISPMSTIATGVLWHDSFRGAWP